MLCKYQLTISDLYRIPIADVKKQLNSLNKEKHVVNYGNFQLCLNLGLRLRKVHHVSKFNKSQRLKPYACRFQHKEKNGCRKKKW